MCKNKYDAYHSGHISKNCVEVLHRKCIVSNYCNADKACIAQVQEFYPEHLFENDIEDCLKEAEKGK